LAPWSSSRSLSPVDRNCPRERLAVGEGGHPYWVGAIAGDSRRHSCWICMPLCLRVLVRHCMLDRGRLERRTQDPGAPFRPRPRVPAAGREDERCRPSHPPLRARHARVRTPTRPLWGCGGSGSVFRVRMSPEGCRLSCGSRARYPPYRPDHVCGILLARSFSGNRRSGHSGHTFGHNVDSERLATARPSFRDVPSSAALGLAAATVRALSGPGRRRKHAPDKAASHNSTTSIGRVLPRLRVPDQKVELLK
jgi:hypothetical protein